MIEKLLRAGAMMAAVACAALPLAASADHSWGPYHWARTANPFTLRLGDNVNSTWDGYLLTASGQWSTSRVLDTTVVAGGTKPRTCKTTSGRVEVCNASYGFNGWLGIAGISITGGQHITAAYVKLNDSYFNTSTYNKPVWRNLVMCQEIGHTFGLDHQDENFDNAPLGTCMDYSANPGNLDQYPNAHDFEQLETIYAHLDTFTTISASAGSSCSPGTPGCGSMGNEPSSWGRLVSTSRDGHRQVFELDLGGGNKILTHVFWVEAQARH